MLPRLLPVLALTRLMETSCDAEAARSGLADHTSLIRPVHAISKTIWGAGAIPARGVPRTGESQLRSVYQKRRTPKG